MNEQLYMASDKYHLRRIAGESILMPAGEYLLDKRNVPVRVNETPAFILETLAQTPMRLGQIVDRVLTEYDVDRKEAEEAAAEMLEQLEKLGAVKKKQTA